MNVRVRVRLTFLRSLHLSSFSDSETMDSPRFGSTFTETEVGAMGENPLKRSVRTFPQKRKAHPTGSVRPLRMDVETFDEEFDWGMDLDI